MAADLKVDLTSLLVFRLATKTVNDVGVYGSVDATQEAAQRDLEFLNLIAVSAKLDRSKSR